MKPRHAAALALVGWYLMMPTVNRSAPGSPSRIMPPGMPLSYWDNASAFDTAESCNSAREARNKTGKEMLEKMKTDSGRELLQKEPDGGAALVAIATADTNAQCVASDDPRLKEK
jgi:hypothetical protein